MPTTLESIKVEKRAASKSLNDKMQDTLDEFTRTGDDRLLPCIKKMLAQAALNDAQDYAASLKDEDMIAALAVLKAATKDMKDTAAVMVGVTKILEKTSAFVAGGAKVVKILQTGKAA
jgi:hypothetical protein